MREQGFCNKVWLYDDSALPRPGSAQEVWFELRAEDVELTSIHTGHTRSTKPEAAELALFYEGEPVGFVNFGEGDRICEIVRADAGEHAFFIKLHCFGELPNGCLHYKTKRGGLVRQYTHEEAKSMHGINRKTCEACRERDAQLDSSVAGWQRVRDALGALLAKTAPAGFTWERAVLAFAEKSPVLEAVDGEASKVVLRFCNGDGSTKGTVMAVTESYAGEPGRVILRFKVYGERDRGAVKPSKQLEDIEYARALE